MTTNLNCFDSQGESLDPSQAAANRIIPQEMVRGAALSAFETVVAGRLEPAVAGLMTMILGGMRIK